MSVPFTRKPVSARLTRVLGGRLGADETQVLNGRPVSLGLTQALSAPALGEAVRRLNVATSAYGSLHCTVRGHWAACSWLHTEVFTEPCLVSRLEDTSSCDRAASGSLLSLAGARPSWVSLHCLLSGAGLLKSSPVLLNTGSQCSCLWQGPEERGYSSCPKGGGGRFLLDSERLGQVGLQRTVIVSADQVITGPTWSLSSLT